MNMYVYVYVDMRHEARTSSVRFDVGIIYAVPRLSQHNYSTFTMTKNTRRSRFQYQHPIQSIQHPIVIGPLSYDLAVNFRIKASYKVARNLRQGQSNALPTGSEVFCVFVWTYPKFVGLMSDRGQPVDSQLVGKESTSVVPCAGVVLSRQSLKGLVRTCTPASYDFFPARGIVRRREHTITKKVSSPRFPIHMVYILYTE
jgi:hypothetical protein